MDRDRLVLIADPEVERGKITAAALVEWGLQPILVHDGVEAILSIQRALPRVAVVDAALPKMFGFQVCELVKRNESLRHIQVALVGAIHNKDRYRRSPNELYGADTYFEQHQLPEALRPILENWGLTIQSATVEEGSEVAPPSAAPIPLVSEAPALDREAPESLQPALVSPSARPAAPMETSSAPLATPEILAPDQPERSPSEALDGDADPEIANAERLARIIVSDIVLYNQKKFEAAVLAGNVIEALQGEIAEGASLFAGRVDPRIREARDFLGDELLRVARERQGT
jgi:CheY-like chemotaxis protein